MSCLYVQSVLKVFLKVLNHYKGLQFLAFVMSCVCYVQGVLCLGFVCLGFVMSRVCLSRVCYVQCLLCLGCGMSSVFLCQGFVCLVFVMSSVCLSTVCYVQCLLCLGSVMSRVCFVQCFVMSRVCLYRVCYVQCLSVQGWLWYLVSVCVRFQHSCVIMCVIQCKHVGWLFLGAELLYNSVCPYVHMKIVSSTTFKTQDYQIYVEQHSSLRSCVQIVSLVMWVNRCREVCGIKSVSWEYSY